MSVLLLRSSAPQEPQSFSTTFDGTENPLSEGGAWRNGGGTFAADWQAMESTPGKCFGVGTTETFEDCVACIEPTFMAFAPNQRVRARIFREVGYTAPSTHEAQLLLRANLNSNNTIDCYEALTQIGSSLCVLVKWRGAIGGFELLPVELLNSFTLQTDDYVIVEVNGTNPAVIEVYHERAGVVNIWERAEDDGSVNGAVITSGQPGIAGFYRSGAEIPKYCWKAWDAEDL
jgi:hypothetical protein